MIVVSTVLAGFVAGKVIDFETSQWVVYAGVGCLQVALYASQLLFLFYRDPERISPNAPHGILSPADGKIIYIKNVQSNTVPRSEKASKKMVLDEITRSSLCHRNMCQIGISMVFTDVHVNRAPIAGKVSLLAHRPGKFLSLRHAESVDLNERQTIVIENERVQVGVIQIASRLVRRIEAYVQEGNSVAMGQRIGMIRFGSQVDVIMPVDVLASVDVTIGQTVVAGETLIARTLH